MTNSKKVLFTVIGYIILLIVLFLIKPIYGFALILATILFSLYSNLSQIYAIMGNRRFAEGDIDSTSIWYKKALSRKDCKPKTRTSYGYLLLKSGRIEEADAILRETEKLKLAPKDDFQLKMTYALVKWKSGNLDEAISMLEYVYNNYKCTTVYESLGYMYILKKDFHKALEFNLEAMDYNKDSNVINDNLGETYYYLGNYDKALEIYDLLIPKNPAFPEPYYHYGLILKTKGNIEKALDMFEKSLTFKQSFLSNLTHEDIAKEIENIKKPE
jgi:tetratricopeptide (TPR) repeat protein